MQTLLETDAPHVALCCLAGEGFEEAIRFVQDALPGIPSNCTKILLTAALDEKEVMNFARLGFHSVMTTRLNRFFFDSTLKERIQTNAPLIRSDLHIRTGIDKHTNSTKHRENAKNLAHGQSVVEVILELFISLPEILHEESVEAIEEHKRRANGALVALESPDDHKSQKQQPTFAKALVNLTGVTRQIASSRKNHGPWHVI